MSEPTGDNIVPAEPADVVDAEIVIDPQALDPALTATDYTDAGVPTFNYVRDKIEKRVTTAVGSEELVGETPEGQAAEDLYEKTKEAAASKLDEIRKSMGK